MDRRQALTFLGAAVACPTCAAIANASEDKGGQSWGYEGEYGPERWGAVSPANITCSIGRQQSPIDLRNPIPAELSDIQVHFRPSKLEVLNNGHTIEVVVPKGSFMVLDGMRYELLQFHFHHPSEHLVEGSSFPMEAHFVHKSAKGDLAVLGAFIAAGEEHPMLKRVWDRMPMEGGKTVRDATIVRPADLLPDDHEHFRYAGSLTTPPCSEIVSWIVFNEPIEASNAQIQKFAGLFPLNARPVQPMNRRFILGSF